MPSQPVPTRATDTPTKRVLLSLVLIGLVALSWTRQLDDAAQTATLQNFQRALAAAALARAFNGVISVAQGTEVALQPVGIGVTLTIGEVLDPLNDLVERFAWLSLIASVSLGLQMTLGDMFASPWLSGLMTAAVLCFLILLWRAPDGAWTQRLMRAVGVLVFARYLLAVVLLASFWIDAAFLSAKQDEAMASLSQTSTSIEAMQETTTTTDAAVEERDLLSALGELIDSSRQQLDLEAQLAAVEAKVEDSVEEIINLIVVFLMQTLLLPIATLWLCWTALKAFWQRLFTPNSG